MASENNAIHVNEHVRVHGYESLGDGEVLRICESGGIYQADVVFDGPGGRRLETFPLDRLQRAPGLWERAERGQWDDPTDFLLKQLAYQFPLANTGGELSNSRTDLLPHQILLTHDLVAATRRRFLVADEVGLGKTIETGMIVRELFARGDAERILVICPAGLIRNWRDELRDCFRLHFDILGDDFNDTSAAAWERHSRVIASIDTVKRPERIRRLVAGPRWDLIIFDEAHHLSRSKPSGKVKPTQNYRLAEQLRNQTRDLLFLSATPHQGDAYQFWSLIQLLDDSLFETPDSMLDHRGLLSRVMIRRTKREVTDAQGQPIFMRRQVHSQSFPLATPERRFYDQLTEYLREGYSAAGIDQKKTTTQQRAVGFVMSTFQKIMSSSPRAIRQALRRRLLVLLAREQMRLEAKAEASAPANAQRIVQLQEEMRAIAVTLLGLEVSTSLRTEADAHVARLKLNLSKKMIAEETTHWALENDEDADAVVYADAGIPDEAEKVRQLLKVVPEGTDRKFHTLIRAIEQLRRENADERFVIFTQYRETLEFLREELGKLYGHHRIATIKGGPLADKIAAVESFWQEDGAKFLIATSAGGEGINLQVCRVLFNYDLGWNPMAAEQRIGRIHRYGQRDTVQVYNLIAEDTVEQEIYLLLEAKLLDIARTIGRVDSATGEVLEDFRTEILGCLGSSPNYQDLYRKALVNRDYARTARELEEMVAKAQTASEALRELAQDLDTFNIESYRALQGDFNLKDIEVFALKAIPRLGGAIVPDGEFWRIETPEVLRGKPNVAARYENATFDRALSMRRRKAELMGLGHPLIDALVAHCQSPRHHGSVAGLKPEGNAQPAVSVRCIFHLDLENGKKQRLYKNVMLSTGGELPDTTPRLDIDLLQQAKATANATALDWPAVREQVEQCLDTIEADLRASHDGVLAVRRATVGMGVVG